MGCLPLGGPLRLFYFRLSRLSCRQGNIDQLVESVVGHGVRGRTQRMLERLERLAVGCAGALCRAFAQFDAAHLASGVGGKIAHGQLSGGAELLIAQ